MNQSRSQETTRALKAAIETQKEVIEDQNERLETTIADLREFGYDADVRVGKDGRVEVNAIETPGKQRLAALSSGVMFSTPGTASRGRGDDNLGVDVPTTSHKEAMDRAIKTLVKQPRVVVSEMKRDVLKQPLRRIEPRMPPKRIERTVSAPPVVSASAFAPVSAAKKVEVPPPPGAAAPEGTTLPGVLSTCCSGTVETERSAEENGSSSATVVDCTFLGTQKNDERGRGSVEETFVPESFGVVGPSCS